MDSEPEYSTNQSRPARSRKRVVFTGLTDDDVPLPELPDEIILEVLLRLPVKSLVRFRCVCKSWLSLFSDPKFINKHLKFWTQQDNLDKWRLVLRYPFYNFKSCSLQSIFHEPYGYAVELDWPLKNEACAARLIGTCNGLVCMYTLGRLGRDEESIFLWNPSTRECRRVPRAKFGKKIFHVITYGFGYDQSVDDYKVVKIACPSGLAQVRVFSLKTNSWRRMPDFHCVLSSKESGKLVSGTLNWGVYIVNGTRRAWGVASFDLARETFQVVPHFDFGNGGFKPVVSVLGGCLCVLCHKPDAGADVWIMREYGVQSSWAMLASIKYLPDMKSLLCPRPLCLLKDAVILVDLSGILGLFDLKENAFKYPIIYGVPDCHEADIYLESLVSPFGNNGIARHISYNLRSGKRRYNE